MNEETKRKYDRAIKEYLKDKKSLTYLSKKFNLNRGRLSSYMKNLGIKVVNRQNSSDIKKEIFDVIDTEEKAYWLGFLYADGCIRNDGHIELGLKESDLLHLEKFKKFLNSKNKISYRKKTKSYRIAFVNRYMVNSLSLKGCFENKSLKIKFPSEDVIPNYLIRHFVRGYFDGDGYLGVKLLKDRISGRMSLVCGSKSFIEDLIERIGWRKMTLKKDKRSNTYQIEWGSEKEVYSMLLELYKDSKIYLERKHNLFLIIQNAALSQGHKKT